MRIQWGIAAAAVLIATAGALSGAAIGESPIVSREDHHELPTAPIVRSEFRPELQRSQPNHHPIETPEGRFEVAELSSRGLYRERHERRVAMEARFDGGQEYGAEPIELAEYRPDSGFADREMAAHRARVTAQRVRDAVRITVGVAEDLPSRRGRESDETMIVADAPDEMASEPSQSVATNNEPAARRVLIY